MVVAVVDGFGEVVAVAEVVVVVVVVGVVAAEAVVAVAVAVVEVVFPLGFAESHPTLVVVAVDLAVELIVASSIRY